MAPSTASTAPKFSEPCLLHTLLVKGEKTEKCGLAEITREMGLQEQQKLTRFITEYRTLIHSSRVYINEDRAL